MFKTTVFFFTFSQSLYCCKEKMCESKKKYVSGNIHFGFFNLKTCGTFILKSVFYKKYISLFYNTF